jgi:phosphomannomutase/phosphoglucomutase
MSPKEMNSKSIGSASNRTTRNSRRLFGTNGIRGVVNRDFTPEFVTKVAGAIGTFFRKGQILVGCDGRTSSQMFFQALVGGLLSTGCTVYNVGVAPTPTVQYAVKHYKMDGGIIITASHNPPEYNGIKVVANDGIELPREKEIKIEKIFWNEKIIRTEWNAIGKTHTLPGILDLYSEAIKKHVDVAAIKRRRCHVVVDPGNGVGALTAPYLLRQIGCQVTTINANVDGTFPSRLSEPRPDNLEELASTVKAVEADVGVAYDGDADRAIFVDETGEIHWGDRTFALIEKHFLQNNPNETIVTPVSSSRLIKDIADKYGGKVVWTKVGSVIVSHTMKKEKANLGGEENGGVFYGPHQPVRDGTMTTALILDIMAKTDKKLSKLLTELPSYYIQKDKTECPNTLKEQVLKELITHVKGLTIETIDGVKIWFPNSSSILIRPSGTEPIYRLYAEGKTRNEAVQLVAEYKAKLRKIVERARGD